MMKRHTVSALLRAAVLVVVCTMLGAGCKDDEQKISDVSALEAADLVGNNVDNADFVILDVRTPAEFAEGHLRNAVNVDFRAPDFGARLQALDRNAMYLVYCGSGGRSAQAVEMMRELDFQEVYNVLGGFAALQNSAPCMCIFDQASAAL